MEGCSIISDYYADRTIFLTGSTGFLGSVLLWKLVSCTACPTITVMVRGGEHRFWKKLNHLLPQTFVANLRQSGRIVVFHGDLTKPQLGLSETALSALSEASIVIHAASSINLNSPLRKIAQTVLFPTLELAQLALLSGSLDRFVYVSTAYANAHLHYEHELVETTVLEQTYPLQHGDTEKELEELRATGSTSAFDATNFPFPYAYAKHLTERALTSIFTSSGQQNKLLTIRPSVLGPALTDPYPYYEVPRSAPATAVLTALVLCPTFRIVFASPFDTPLADSNIDEVPVDLVANQMIVHTAFQSTGHVHCVASRAGRRTFGDIWEKAMKLRALPWQPQVQWKSVDWKSAALHPVARFFAVVGTSFDFDQSRSKVAWERLLKVGDGERFPIFLRSCRDIEDLSQRQHAVSQQLTWFLRRYHLPQWVLDSFIRSDL